jgi:hypothetical protein
MRLDALHRKICDDVRVIHAATASIWPPEVPARYNNKMVSIKTFVKRLNAATDGLGVFCEVQEDREVSPGLIFNSALWLGKENLPENGSNADIRILYHINPKTKRVQMTQPEWNRRRYYFWQNVLHELIHRYQDTYRTPDRDIRVYRPQTDKRNLKEDQEYFGNYDEIETWSHACAVEFFVWWGHLSIRDATREAMQYSGRLVTPTYNQYREAFADTPSHPAMRQFTRKVRSWYDIIQKNPEIYATLSLPNLVTS